MKAHLNTLKHEVQVVEKQIEMAEEFYDRFSTMAEKNVPEVGRYYLPTSEEKINSSRPFFCSSSSSSSNLVDSSSSSSSSSTVELKAIKKIVEWARDYQPLYCDPNAPKDWRRLIKGKALYFEEQTGKKIKPHILQEIVEQELIK